MKSSRSVTHGKGWKLRIAWKTEKVECGWGCGLEQGNVTEGMCPLNRINELALGVCAHEKNEYGCGHVLLVRVKGNRTECNRDADSALFPTESPAETHRAHTQAKWEYECKVVCSVWDEVFVGVF